MTKRLNTFIDLISSHIPCGINLNLVRFYIWTTSALYFIMRCNLSVSSLKFYNIWMHTTLTKQKFTVARPKCTRKCIQHFLNRMSTIARPKCTGKCSGHIFWYAKCVSAQWTASQPFNKKATTFCSKLEVKSNLHWKEDSYNFNLIHHLIPFRLVDALIWRLQTMSKII